MTAQLFPEEPGEEPEEEKPGILIILSNQALDGMNVVTQFAPDARALISCQDSISPQSETLNNHQISMLLDTAEGQSLPAVQERSMRYITNQLSMLAPVLLCILCLTCMSFVSGSAIITKRNMHDFGVYFICGMRWNRCMLLQLYNSVLVSLISLVSSILLVLICGRLAILRDTVITLGGWQLLSSLVLLTLNLVVSVLLPVAILRRTTPNQILKTN